MTVEEAIEVIGESISGWVSEGGLFFEAFADDGFEIGVELRL